MQSLILVLALRRVSAAVTYVSGPRASVANASNVACRAPAGAVPSLGPDECSVAGAALYGYASYGPLETPSYTGERCLALPAGCYEAYSGAVSVPSSKCTVPLTEDRVWRVKNRRAFSSDMWQVKRLRFFSDLECQRELPVGVRYVLSQRGGACPYGYTHVNDIAECSAAAAHLS